MLPPSLPPITDADLELLDALRLERFRSRFGQILRGANLFISGLDRTLIISGGQTVGALRHRQLDLLEQSWQVCASRWVKVYQCNELIYDACCNKLGGKVRGEDMATAIQEQVDKADSVGEPDSSMRRIETENGAIESQSTGEPDRGAKIVRSMSLADIAEDLEADTPSLQAFLEEQNAVLINFNGTILVTETSARVAYEQYSLVRARQKMDERFAALNKSASPELPSANKSTARSETKPKKNYLTWKREFKVNKSSYRKTVQNALEALFPDAPDEQLRALTDIVNGGDLGKGIVDKISRNEAYTDKVRAREQLLKAATELVIPTEASDEEKDVEAVV